MVSGTQTRILDAVLAVIAEEGPKALTFRAVAATSGIAVGNVTYHFPNRTELIQAAFAHHLERLRTEAEELPLDGVEDLSHEDRVAIVMGFLEHMATVDRLRYLAEFELTLEAARDADLRQVMQPHAETTRTTAIELLTRVGSTDPENDATILSALMEGLLLGWLARPDDAAHRARIQSAIDRTVALLLP